ncbi:MAG: hypothetical protein AAF511_03885 [Pseudomonadota bacterium]
MGLQHGFDDSHGPVVIERYHERAITGRFQARLLLTRLTERLLFLAAMALPLAGLAVTAMAAADLSLPVFGGDGRDDLASAVFLSRGDLAVAGGLIISLFMARRFGAPVVTRALLLAWATALVGGVAVVIEIAPQLNEGDFPSTRYLFVLISSWIIGQVAGLSVYDLTRGGAWWRAPFFGVMLGLGMQAAVYFPGAFAGQGVPWLWWLAMRLVAVTAVAVAFSCLYAPLRRLIRPRLGLGGRY